MVGRAALVAGAWVLAAVSGCGASPSTPQTPGPPAAEAGFGHVHGLGLNPADGQVYAATHYGVFRLDDSGPVRVADRYQDTMGFTVAGPDVFLASGHPPVTEPGPPHLGLVRTTDRAQTWEPVSLGGEADFHALSAAGATVYGWDSQSARVMRSDDGGATWQAGAALQPADLDVDPLTPARVLATTQAGLLESRDGGATFAPAPSQPPEPLVLLGHRATGGATGDPAAGTPPGVIGVTSAGAVWASTADGWARATPLPSPPQAFTVAGDGTVLAATDAGVHESRDEGQTWRLLAASEHH